jgi:hypothetical protein
MQVSQECSGCCSVDPTIAEATYLSAPPPPPQRSGHNVCSVCHTNDSSPLRNILPADHLALTLLNVLW